MCQVTADVHLAGNWGSFSGGERQILLLSNAVANSRPDPARRRGARLI